MQLVEEESAGPELARVLATCTLGLGFSYKGFLAGLEREPHAIACDAGSSDFGPYFLGSGEIQKSRLTLKRDLEILLAGARRLNVPFLTGSAGGAGGRPHLDGMVSLVQEVAADKNLRMRVARVDATVSTEWLRAKLRSGALRPVGKVEPVTEQTLERMTCAVAMMGAQPFMDAVERGADVVLAGRAVDPAIFAAVPLLRGAPEDVVWHAAKSIDKGYLATTRPDEGSPVLARIFSDHFILEPTKEGARCSVPSVASLTLHENPNPYQVAQPTGTIDTHAAVYEQIDEQRVKVSGSRYVRAAHPTLKIEGAELVGYRTLLIAGMRDPRVLERLPEFLAAFRAAIERGARSMGIAQGDYQLGFRVYGQDAVLGEVEPLAGSPGHEVGLICDVVGRTKEISEGIASRLGPTGSRLDISGKLGGGGNFAYPFSPSLIKMGPVYRWSVWHLADTSEAEMRDLFKIEMLDA